MTAVQSEKAEMHRLANSHIKENGESNGSIRMYPSTHKIYNLKLCAPDGLQVCINRRTVFYIAFGSLMLNLVLAILILRLSVRRREPSPALPTCPAVSCPSGWVGYQEKCYYFAVAEGNWAFSKTNCSSLNASLAGVDSQEEMDFMMRYKGNADHWIGLQRNQSQPWKWINGTIFNGWFPIRGGGSCAYVNQQGIASSSCSREEPWICSKAVGR
ncbi:C-type lectin domain family 2 member B-like [Eublepharis macularius]|uniref:C-type lectin domain family 2 member B-like n=1 Tax=Eublepharis macularius TaxID=481883 RepID=A0AA97JBI0_EUBMA|nr:C-type lectin domain family 2 member B-like [Eublepharis macularius]